MGMNPFFDTVKKLKHSGPSPLACPSCGSTRIRQQGSLSGWLLPAVYACHDCGYVGALILEIDEDPEHVDKDFEHS
jgi:predicted RNA-binding Zn-ribbon protein involved in translation (DUF1610 family)